MTPILFLIVAAYILASFITFVVYYRDKSAAMRNGPRTRERTIHYLELLGGWPGALLAQQCFHHKRRKTRYMLVFWSIVLLHAIAWALWLGHFL